MAFTIESGWARPAPWRGRSDAIRYRGLPGALVEDRPQDDDGSLLASVGRSCRMLHRRPTARRLRRRSEGSPKASSSTDPPPCARCPSSVQARSIRLLRAFCNYRRRRGPSGWRSHYPCPGRSGGTGRRAGLKIRCPKGRVGSSPTFATGETMFPPWSPFTATPSQSWMSLPAGWSPPSASIGCDPPLANEKRGARTGWLARK